MDSSTFTISAVIATIFFIVKFFMSKFLSDSEEDEDDNETTSKYSFKMIIRDTALVYISVWIGMFILEQFQTELGGGKAKHVPPMVFTDPPNF